MTDPIKALVVDPTKRTVEEVMLPTVVADPEEGCGVQVDGNGSSRQG
jgi:hypothetical protein